MRKVFKRCLVMLTCIAMLLGGQGLTAFAAEEEPADVIAVEAAEPEEAVESETPEVEPAEEAVEEVPAEDEEVIASEASAEVAEEIPVAADSADELAEESEEFEEETEEEEPLLLMAMEEENSDFKIKDGVLVKYRGKDNNVVIPDGVTEIGGNAFNGCYKIKEITIPNTVKKIGGYAFQDCTNITEITIPDDVTYIGERAFMDCARLKKITIPDTVKRLGWEAFYGCNSLTEISIPNTITVIEEGLFAYCNSLKKVIIPESVITIERFAFHDCTSLKEVIIPSEVTTIERKAFLGCYVLSEITIQNPETIIGSEIFKDCNSLTKIYVTKGSGVESQLREQGYGDRIYYIGINYSITPANISLEVGKSTTLKIENLPLDKSVIWKSDDESIASVDANGKVSAFRAGTVIIRAEIDGVICDSCTLSVVEPDVLEGFVIKDGVLIRYRGAGGNVTIPYGVTEIGEKAFFYSKESLVSVTMPDTVVKIGDEAFKDCRNLVSVELSNNLVSIGKRCFYGTRIAKIRIPGSVRTIGYGAFDNSGLFVVLYEGLDIDYVMQVKHLIVYSTSAVAWDYYHPLQPGIDMPVSDYEAYTWQREEIWNGIVLETIDVGDTVDLENDFIITNDRNGRKLVAYTGNAEEVVIPEGINIIGESAFEDNNTVKKVVFPKSVNVIYPSAFIGCHNLEEIVFSDSLYSIYDCAFGYCNNIQKITIYGDTKYINNRAFYSNSTTKNITVYLNEGSACEEYFKKDKRFTIVYLKNDVPVPTNDEIAEIVQKNMWTKDPGEYTHEEVVHSLECLAALQKEQLQDQATRDFFLETYRNNRDAVKEQISDILVAFNISFEEVELIFKRVIFE